MSLIRNLNWTILLCLSCIFNFTLCKFLDESEERIKKRFEWNRSKAADITNGKVTFKYTEQTGTFCKAEKDIFFNEPVFKIPYEYLICGQDIYPFKYEMFEIILKFYSEKYKLKEYFNNYLSQVSIHLMTYYLLFIDYDDREKIIQQAIIMNKKHYNIHPTKEQIEYLKSLPTVTYSKEMYDKEEFELLNIGHIDSNMIDNIIECHEFIVKELNNNKKLADILLPILEDQDNYRYWYSIVSNRAYRMYNTFYEKIYNKKIEDWPTGQINKEVINKINKDGLSCLIPFFDLCNHKGHTDISSKKGEFNLYPKKGYIMQSIRDSFKSNTEYNYSYVSKAGNDKLLLNYGFYLDNNVDSTFTLKIVIYKEYLSKEKISLFEKYKLLPMSLESFLKSNSFNNAVVTFSLNKSDINDVLKFFRIYIISNNSFNEQLINERISNNQYISYDNELLSLYFLKSSIYSNMNSNKLNYNGVLQSLELTRNYYKENKDSILSNKKLIYTYRLRRKIMEVVRENFYIMYKNNIIANQNLNTLLSDQLSKLRDYYVEKSI